MVSKILDKFTTITVTGSLETTTIVVIPYILYLSKTSFMINGERTVVLGITITPFISLAFSCGCL